MRRRTFLATLGALAARPAFGALAARPAEVSYPAVIPGYTLVFPRDHGAHPDFRTEWWYVTGWLKTARGEDLGFQVTFFRTRAPYASDNPSAFAPRQLLLAHAALADPKLGRLRHDQRAARSALGVAGADEGTTRTGSTRGAWSWKGKSIARSCRRAISAWTCSSFRSVPRSCRGQTA